MLSNLVEYSEYKTEYRTLSYFEIYSFSRIEYVVNLIQRMATSIKDVTVLNVL